ncbi:hypothetical protein L873DRAFT_1818169 [Choiromyces venosus 120613-1]|uniref:Uncharacterized protein n=1 Tax=Choiromyces venosus 120613-1 TaxID=1336337 RepID=A0A3N4J4P9_9PEZI|nr:hypothetical protein L873DRAFT_1818169 [Choiromyces venosus 120613-1]
MTNPNNWLIMCKAFGNMESWGRKTGEEKLDIFGKEWRKQFGDGEDEDDWGLGSDGNTILSGIIRFSARTGRYLRLDGVG